MGDLMSVLVRLGDVVPSMIMLLQSIIGLIGLWLTSGALVELWGAHNPNANKYLAGNRQFSTASALVQLVIGGVLAAMSTLQLVGVLSRTLTEDFASSRFLTYTPADNSFDEQRLAAMAAILGIMQVVGLIAMVKGWLTINSHVKGQSKTGYGMAFAWLIGGVICWNFKWFTDVLNCTVGFNIIGIFNPFGVASCS